VGTDHIDMQDRLASDRRVEFSIDEEHPRNGVVLLTVRGEADLQVAPELRDRLESALDTDARSIVLDLSEVTFVDSMTLGVLVGSAKRARASGGELRLVTPAGPVRRILEVTLLDRVFPVDETRDDALAATPAV
jgi:anti-sigma B factor antagonist